MAKGEYEIPFDKNGNQMDYEGWNVHEMVPNHEFEDTLTYLLRRPWPQRGGIHLRAL